MNYGDILALEGSSWLSRDIIRLTRRAGGGEQASHVGVITAMMPFVQVTEALMDVKTRMMTQSIANASRAWVLSMNGLTESQRLAIASRALSFSGQVYGFTNIGLQLFDGLFKTRWFTDHLATRKYVICSELADMSYQFIGQKISPLNNVSITPNDILGAALANPTLWTVTQVK